MTESESDDYFEQVPLESAFDDLHQISRGNGTYCDYISFGYIKWLHLGGSPEGQFLRARVGATVSKDGSEQTFTFRGEFENLYKLMIAKKEGVVE